MAEPEKPFACTIPDCRMTFTNEDHLNVHTKKHDMMLQFDPEQKAYVADQTPTPTRFIRNCEEVGLFQDLQNVNPFDEGFKRAMETKHGILSLENVIVSDDLHTPQMVYPLIDSGDSTLYSTTNNQRNITISRSSSDESGAIKEFETTTISKLTNEVTTISRIVGKHDDNQKHEENTKDGIRKDSVSYTNNVIKIHSNVEIRKDNVEKNPLQTLISYEDTIIKDSIVTKDVLLTDSGKTNMPDLPPIMSQKSIDRVVDSLTADFSREDYKRNKKDEDYEVIIKLPNGKKVRMKAVEDVERTQNAKEKLKKALKEKADSKVPFQRLHSVPNAPLISNLLPITTGTLIPVTILNQNQMVHKIPILPLPVKINKAKKPVKRKKCDSRNSDVSKCDVNSEKCSVVSETTELKKNPQDLDSRSAASRRYRARLKETWSRQNEEIKKLRDANERLTAEKAVLKVLVTEHMKHCPNADDLRNIQEKLNHAGANI